MSCPGQSTYVGNGGDKEHDDGGDVNHKDTSQQHQHLGSLLGGVTDTESSEGKQEQREDMKGRVKEQHYHKLCLHAKTQADLRLTLEM